MQINNYHLKIKTEFICHTEMNDLHNKKNNEIFGTNVDHRISIRILLDPEGLYHLPDTIMSQDCPQLLGQNITQLITLLKTLKCLALHHCELFKGLH